MQVGVPICFSLFATSGSFKRLFDQGIFESNAFRVMLGEPGIGGFLARENLQVIAVANQLAGVDINSNCHRSLFSFRLPQ